MARLTPFERFVGARDQVLTCLDQHLDGHVVGDLILFDQPAHEIEVGLAGRRKANFDLLETDLYQQGPETLLLFDAHRLEQRLVAVA